MVLLRKETSTIYVPYPITLSHYILIFFESPLLKISFRVLHNDIVRLFPGNLK